MRNLMKQNSYQSIIKGTYSPTFKTGQQVLDYIELFYLVQARCGLDKWEEIAAYRQCHGLRLDIQHLLAFQYFYAVDRGTTCVKSKRDGQPSTCEFSSFKRISKSSVTHIQVPKSNHAKIQNQVSYLIITQEGNEQLACVLSLSGKRSFIVPMFETTSKARYM